MKKRIVPLLIILTLLLTFAACEKMPAAQPEDSDIQTTQESTTEAAESSALTEKPTETAPETTEPPTETVPETTEPPVEHTVSVETCFSREIEGSGKTFHYSIPAVYLDGEPMETVNDAIWTRLYDELYAPYVEERSEPSYRDLEYEWQMSGGMLSIVARYVNCLNTMYEYSIFNVNVDQGRLAFNEELWEAFGYSEEEFYEAARNVMGARFVDSNRYLEESFTDSFEKAYYYDMLKGTISPQNVMQAQPFVGQDGTLFILGSVATSAGGGWFNSIMSMQYTITEEHLNAMYMAEHPEELEQ